MPIGGNKQPSISQAEHIGPNDTGDNISAKKVAIYVWDGANWTRMGNGLVPSGYDYIGLTYVASGNGAGEIETVTYKTGGSGGTTIATLTLTYDASDRIATVTKS